MANALRAMQDRIAAILLTPVTALACLVFVVVQSGELGVERFQEGLPDVFEEVFLVVLDREGIVPALVHDLLGDGLLAAHRVDSYQRAVEVQQLQQHGNGRDFVGFGVHRYLAQGQVLGRGPGTHQVQRPELCRTGATQGLAVDGYMLDPQSGTDGLHPFPKASLERLGLEPIEDTLEGVVRGDAVGQLQEGAQPVAAFASEGHDLLPILGPGDDRAQSDDDDVLQAVQAPVGSPGVLELGKECGDRQIGLLLRKLGKRGHRSPP